MPHSPQPTAEQIKKALLPQPDDELDPLDELIATGEAVFALVRLTKLNPEIKGIVYQLEKQFNFYAGLAETARPQFG